MNVIEVNGIKNELENASIVTAYAWWLEGVYWARYDWWDISASRWDVSASHTEMRLRYDHTVVLLVSPAHSDGRRNRLRYGVPLELVDEFPDTPKGTLFYKKKERMGAIKWGIPQTCLNPRHPNTMGHSLEVMFFKCLKTPTLYMFTYGSFNAQIFVKMHCCITWDL